MATPRHLAHAPIMEATVDLRIQALEGMTVAQLEQALASSEFGYTKTVPILRGQFNFTVNAESSPMAQAWPSETSIIGVRLDSSDKKYVAQLTLEGFTLSRLEPYESWELLIAEAQRVWQIYRTCVKATRIQRTATRFINNLRLPMHPGERFEKFLTGLPSIMPSDYPQAISSFLQRFVVHDEPSGATAILTQALDRIPTEPVLPVILDIDVSRETKFPADSPDVWDYLTDLRALKNRFFFGALTEEAVRLYE